MPEAQTHEPRASTMVVTGETRAAFMEKRLDIAAPPAKPAEPVVVTAPAETAKAEPAKAEPAKAAEPPKDASTIETELAEVVEEQKKPQPDPAKRQRLQSRFSELTHAKKEAEAKASAAEDRAKAAEKRAQEAEDRAKAQAAPPAEPGDAPQRAAFQSEEAYQDALIDYRVDKKIADRQKAEAEARARADGERVVQTYTERLAATKKAIPDFDARIEANKDMPIAPHIRDAIFESEVGPRMALYFADHPEEAKRINGLSQNAALREFGKIESMIETEAKPAPTPEPAKPAAQVSRAPAPISPIKATNAGELEPPVDSAGNFKGSYADFKKLRQTGKLR